MPDEPHHEPVPATGTRRDLIHAAYARIAAEGFEGLRTRDVAADVGVNVATLHYHFPTKEALIQAAVRHATSRFGATLSSRGTPADQLRGHLEGIRSLLKTDQDLWQVMSEFALRAVRDEATAAMARQADDQWFGYLRNLIERGVTEGCLDPDLQPDNVAATLIATIRGLSMPTGSPTRPERVDRAIDQLERWLNLPPAPPPEAPTR
jgi:AcrR family transcriptional regulator